MTGKRTAQEVILGPLVVHVGKIQNCFPASHPYAKVILYGFKGGFKDLPGKDKKFKPFRRNYKKEIFDFRVGKIFSKTEKHSVHKDDIIKLGVCFLQTIR